GVSGPHEMEASQSTVDGPHRATHRRTRIDLWSFKLIEVYIEHGVTVLDSYLRAPRFRATLEDITDEPAELNGEASFADVAGSGVDSSGLSHDESFGVNDLDMNLNEPINQNVSQVETKYKLNVFEEPDVGPTQEPILVKVRTQEPIVAEVRTQEPIMAEEDGEDAEQGNRQEDESTPTDGQFFYDDEGIYNAYETEYDAQSSEDACTNADDDVDEEFLVVNDVDVHLFGISMDLPFDNIGITNLVSGDVLEGEDVDVINADGIDSDPGNDEDKNYKKRMLAELRTKMEGVINASSQWKRNLKLYKNDNVRIRSRYEGKVSVFTMSQGTGPTGPYSGMEAGPSGSSGSTTRSKKRKNTVGQDGLGGSGAGAIIGLSVAAGKGGAGDPGGAGVASQGSSHTRWTRGRFSNAVSQTRNEDGREIGNGVPTQSSVAGSASEWSFL
nr:hypothetical protein [Tanacetum cinerariifolium]